MRPGKEQYAGTLDTLDSTIKKKEMQTLLFVVQVLYSL